MPVVTETELVNAQLDCVTLKDVVNGSESINGTGNVTSRLGTIIKSLKKVITDVAATTVNSTDVANMLNRVNSVKNPRWFLGLDGDCQFNQLIGDMPREIRTDARAKFGYDGKYLRVSAPALGNAFIFWPATEILKDSAYQIGNTVSVEFEVRSDSTKPSSVYLYRQNAGVQTFVAQSVVNPGTTVKKIKVSGTIDPTNLEFLVLRFFMDTGTWDVPFDIGRLNIYGGPDLNLIEFQTDVIKYNDLKTIEPVEFPRLGVQLWGDSLLSAHFTNNWLGPMVNNRPMTYFNYGGEASPQIRKRFLAASPSGLTTVFWTGTNNIGNADMLVEDTQRMIAHLGHKRFIVMPPLNSGPPNAEMLRAESMLADLYQNKFLNIRKRLVEGYTYAKTRLTANFTQPALNGDVTIGVSSTVPFTVGNEIRIGQKNLADRYSVQTIVSGTSMTVRLLEVANVASGSTVTNLVFSGPDGSYIETSWLPVIMNLDYIDYQDRRVPNGFRGDSIHLNTDGGIFVANQIAEKLYELNY